MASSNRKLSSCIAYNIRMAKRTGRTGAVNHLWAALYSLTPGTSQAETSVLLEGVEKHVTNPQIISLAECLGIHEHTDVEMKAGDRSLIDSISPRRSMFGCSSQAAETQTETRMYTDSECQHWSEKLVAHVLEEAKAAIRCLGERVKELESKLLDQRDTRCLGEAVKQLESQLSQRERHPLAVVGSSVSSHDIRGHGEASPAQTGTSRTGQGFLVGSDVACEHQIAFTLDQLKDQHIAHRKALKQQRRAARQIHQHENAQ